MAGDWIPMRLYLANDPAVIGVAASLGVVEDHVVGMLQRFWSWANEQLENGHAASVTKMWLDRFMQRDGFASALEKEGWLRVNSDGSIAIPKFDVWNSKGAKRRLLAAKRQKNARNNSHASVTKRSRSKRDKSVTREEKRREENNTPLPPLLDTPRFRDSWASWLSHRRQKNKPATPAAQAMALKKLAEMGEPRAVAAIEHSVANGWEGIFEPKNTDKQPSHALDAPNGVIPNYGLAPPKEWPS